MTRRMPGHNTFLLKVQKLYRRVTAAGKIFLRSCAM
uniref:Uncharacterized protein n=1 Tax=Anguilla anguilla TaxID=7936 RepID=A0A0E9RVG4_ANGAN